MKLNVLDASGVPQQLLVEGLEAITDKSGSITATGVSQVAIAANSARSGFLIQNRSLNPMHINDLGAATVGASSFTLAPGECFPPAGYPITANAINILGTVSDIFSAREW
jgi:hypothetical protein